MKNMKKVIAVLLCIATMFAFLTLISSAADVAAADDGSETIMGILQKLIEGANWGQIFGILVQSLIKIGSIFGALIGG